MPAGTRCATRPTTTRARRASTERHARSAPQGTPVEWVEEESYFFKLSAYQDKLLKLYADVPDFVLPRERLNEVASFVRGGLKDLSVSRTTFDWGVKVPGDEKHVMYVWVDALTNYITAVGYPDTESPTFKKNWPADLHVIGKDIVRFHAVYWPAFLMSAGIAVPRQHLLPRLSCSTAGKRCRSRSATWSIRSRSADAYGVDPLRYFLHARGAVRAGRQLQPRGDRQPHQRRPANDLGNLAQRSLTMIGKQLGGVMPEPGAFSANDKTILAAADAMIGKARDAMKTQRCTRCSMRSGPWWRTPTAISPARRRGRSPRPIRRGRERCCT